MGPCFEIVGFRQRNKQFNYLGDICSDFGFNIKFIVGKKIKFWLLENFPPQLSFH